MFRNVKTVLLLIVLGVVSADPVCANGTDNLLRLFQNPIVMHTIYSHEHMNPYGVGPDGAVGVNQQHERGQSDKWFIEMQRFGGDYVQAGLAGSQNPGLVDLGVRVLRWGFSKQQPDGSFAGSGDLYHSSSLFLDAALRATLLMKESDPAKYGLIISEFTPRIVQAMNYLHQPSVQKPGDAANEPFTHRRWVFAAIYQMTAQLTGDPNWTKGAEKYVRLGLALQTPDGINPEKGGYDVSYQTLGILYAEKWYVNSQNSELKAQVLQMIKRGLAWESTHVDTFSGNVEVGLSTRIGTGHSGRGGGEKKVDYKSMIQAYAFATELTNDNAYSATANAVARQLGV